MLVEWKRLLAETKIPESRWPVDVREIDVPDEKTIVPRLVTRVMYPLATPATVYNPETGRKEWNPEVKESLELIYKAYRSCLGKLNAPAWNKSGNYVEFDQAV